MGNFGLSTSEIDAILKKYIDGHIKINDEFVRNAISEAIEANNQKLLQDIKSLLDSK